ncbi:MAG TPA: NeuD/PglB/VioB family sugar acetyltransferase [Phycisphaerales bacterium]|nr:NeuD/PglB/VioB family sugar acetyltransferase [Phycisphaerales bacterium]
MYAAAYAANPSDPREAMTSVPSELVLIGGGGHAVVVAEAARASGIRVVGVYDDDERCAACREPDGAQWLGPLAHAGELDSPWILSLGDLGLRAAVLARLTSAGAPAERVLHPSAVISPTATLGRGVFVGPLAVVHARARVAAHAIVNTGAIVEHDCEIGENVHLAPRCVLGGAVRVGANTLVGLGAAVLPGLAIGARCTLGAGAVVRGGVDENARVVGVPARPLH